MPADRPPYAPYRNGAANEIYNLLFCDDPAAFANAALDPPVRANDATQEGRLRYLAYLRLRSSGQAVPGKVLLGVIVEVALRDGLDVLAAFSEGGVRYINHAGKVAVFEGVASLEPDVRRLFAASESVVARIGPWEGPRRPPPGPGNVRLTFLLSDGLAFGEGPMTVMQRDAMAGPIIQSATDLLQTIVPVTGRP